MYRKPVVLVVDDSRSVAESIAMLLEQSGYNAIFATSGEAALEVVAGVAVDIAIVDVQLTGIDGLQTAIEICKRLPHCKIALMSGQSESIEQVERAAKEGLDFPVLAKPIPPAELLATVDSLRPAHPPSPRALD